MVKSDFTGLPLQTRQFVEHLHSCGLDRVRIHGLFVMLGLCAGAPDTREKLDELAKCLDPIVPVDRTKNLDEVVGDIYDGYHREINEFCYRSGAVLEFRKVTVPGVERTFSIVYLKDYGLLDADVMSIEKLGDASRLYDAFVFAIGRYTADKNASLLEAFSCGIFQIQLHAQVDIRGAKQISELIKTHLPLLYSQYLFILLDNEIEYFLGLERGHVALLPLMQSMDSSYGQQMWCFLSSLFCQNQELIPAVDDLDIREWYEWVLRRADRFDRLYPCQLVPFSASKITLADWFYPNSPAMRIVERLLTKSGKSAFWSMIWATLIRNRTGLNPDLILSHRTKC